MASFTFIWYSTQNEQWFEYHAHVRVILAAGEQDFERPGK
jgi:hypothetical protein